jgi:hypothetical protein
MIHSYLLWIIISPIGSSHNESPKNHIFLALCSRVSDYDSKDVWVGVLVRNVFPFPFSLTFFKQSCKREGNKQWGDNKGEGQFRLDFLIFT